MTPTNSFPVRYQLAPIPRDFGPYLEGFRWAEPDLEHASFLMREVSDNRVDSAERGRQAANDMASLRTPARTGRQVRQRLEEIQ
jgi:predicted dienelactone hydrolase